MGTILNDQFIKEVYKELKHLRNNATKEEIARLNITTFDSKNNTLCIYGQMTGSCHNSRTYELYHKSFENFDSFEYGMLVTYLELYIYYNTNKKIINNIIKYLKKEINVLSIPQYTINFKQ